MKREASNLNYGVVFLENIAVHLIENLFLCIADVDSVLLRMTIIGVLLSFRNLAQEALNDVSHS